MRRFKISCQTETSLTRRLNDTAASALSAYEVGSAQVDMKPNTALPEAKGHGEGREGHGEGREGHGLKLCCSPDIIVSQIAYFTVGSLLHLRLTLFASITLRRILIMVSNKLFINRTSRWFGMVLLFNEASGPEILRILETLVHLFPEKIKSMSVSILVFLF